MLIRPIMDMPWLGALLHRLLVQEQASPPLFFEQVSPRLASEHDLSTSVQKNTILNIVSLNLHKHLILTSEYKIFTSFWIHSIDSQYRALLKRA